MSSQELSEGTLGEDVQLGEWAVVTDLHICFSASEDHVSPAVCKQKKATHTEEFSSQCGREV